MKTLVSILAVFTFYLSSGLASTLVIDDFSTGDIADYPVSVSILGDSSSIVLDTGASSAFGGERGAEISTNEMLFGSSNSMTSTLGLPSGGSTFAEAESINLNLTGEGSDILSTIESGLAFAWSGTSASTDYQYAIITLSSQINTGTFSSLAISGEVSIEDSDGTLVTSDVVSIDETATSMIIELDLSGLDDISVVGFELTTVATVGDDTFDIDVTLDDVSLSQVPEPNSLALVGLFSVGAFIWRRRFND